MAKTMHACQVILLLSVFMILTTECFDSKALRARRKPEFDSLFEEAGAVGDLISQSLAHCFSTCFENLKCLTLFYNSETRRCVMHSRDFIYQTPGAADTGWKFYITEDVSGRCPPPNYYYRYLDFCYTVEQAAAIKFSNIKAACTNKGSSLSTITSQEYQDYFEHFLAGRLTDRVCLAGTVRSDSMVELGDESVLSYYSWYPGEPDSPGVKPCLVMKLDNGWNDVPCSMPDKCVSVCELK